MFVLSRLSAAADLAEAINSIEAADSKWVASGVGVFEVGAARQLGIDPTLSPEECEWPTIALGHASLRGLTKQRRGSLLLSIQVKRRPKPL